MSDKIYFISGHRNITDDEFINNYAKVFNRIEITYLYQKAMNKIDDIDAPLYVVGDYDGVDILSQNYLIDNLMVDPSRITVYHMGDYPQNYNSKIINLIGGFNCDEDRDAAMTNDSTDDIAFVRNHLELSGTAMNILRRKILNKVYK